MTLEQCKTKLKPLFNVREKQEDLDDQFVETAKFLKDLGNSSMETALRVVSAVKADPVIMARTVRFTLPWVMCANRIVEAAFSAGDCVPRLPMLRNF